MANPRPARAQHLRKHSLLPEGDPACNARARHPITVPNYGEVTCHNCRRMRSFREAMIAMAPDQQQLEVQQ